MDFPARFPLARHPSSPSLYYPVPSPPPDDSFSVPLSVLVLFPDRPLTPAGLRVPALADSFGGQAKSRQEGRTVFPHLLLIRSGQPDERYHPEVDPAGQTKAHQVGRA